MKDNKLIAEFMGGKFYTNAVLQPNYSKSDCFVGIENIPISKCEKRHYYVDSLLAPHVTELKYHESWDWLMPVVEKIESLGFNVNFGKTESLSDDPKVYGIDTYIRFQITNKTTNDKRYWKCFQSKDSLKEATYKTVVEFIKWYNKEKQ